MSPMMPREGRRDRRAELADLALEDLERPAKFHRARRFGRPRDALALVLQAVNAERDAFARQVRA